jgi:hypothetical protein
MKCTQCIDGSLTLSKTVRALMFATNLAKTVKQALDLTDWEGKKTGA